MYSGENIYIFYVQEFWMYTKWLNKYWILGKRGKFWIFTTSNCFNSVTNFLLHDWAIYRIYTFCTSVGWQIIEGNLHKSFAGHHVSSPSSWQPRHLSGWLSRELKTSRACKASSPQTWSWTLSMELSLWGGREQTQYVLKMISVLLRGRN